MLPLVWAIHLFVNTFTHADSDVYFLLHGPQYEAIYYLYLRPPIMCVKLCTFTPADVDLERKLLDPKLASCELNEDTLQQLADVIGDKWPSIASLLSFTTADIEQIRSEDCPAQAMLQKLKDNGTLTHEQLCTHLQTISLLSPAI